jgi:hypothetical protein
MTEIKIDNAPVRRRHLPVIIPNVSRNDLPAYFKKLGFKVGAEVGVYKGQFMELFCKEGFKMYGIEPYKAYDGYDVKDKDFQAVQEAILLEATKRLSPYPNYTLIRKTSMEAVKDFEDESLDFVYIDGHHGFKYIAEDLWEWSKKVKKGGIICGHDYFALRKDWRGPYCSHVKEVVDAFTLALDINPWYVLGERHAKPGEIRDPYRSWMWTIK